MKKLLILGIVLTNFFALNLNAEKWVGGDISLLTKYEQAGAQYKDENGKLIADFIPWCKEEGMNAMRVRLFVNPKKYQSLHANDANSDTKYDPNACQDLTDIIPLCQRIVNSGMALMLDFHYSDTWADPGKQWTPIDWQTLNDAQLKEKIYDYTKECLETLKSNGVIPSFIQTGNEISYGMLWGPVGTSNPQKVFMGNSSGWSRFGDLLKSAGKACREVCPDAKIVLHTERVASISELRNFYQKMNELGVEYEIIGLSYYPYFHGDMTNLSNALTTTQSEFSNKEVMIVETGYSYAWEVPGSKYNFTGKWQYSTSGQQAFALDLVDTLKKFNHVNGLFWWWMEYNAYSTSLSGWYNAPLFDSRNGMVTPAFRTSIL